MFKVGLTGGIGSGKTTVARVFEMLGVPVYYSDERAKSLMLGSDLASRIRAEFGEEAYTKDGELARGVIAKAVFGNPVKLEKLNSIVHPALIRDFLRWADAQSAPYVVQEAAVLIESGADKAVDRIIVVDAPLETRIERVMKRDNTTKEAVMARIASQISDQERLAKADYTITADGLSMLVPQIVKIDEEIRKIIITLQSK